MSAILIRPVSGILLDKIGRKSIFLIGLIIFIISVLSYNLISSLTLVLVFRFIHGFGWGAAITASNTMASDNIPKEPFGEGMGYFSLASLLMSFSFKDKKVEKEKTNTALVLIEKTSINPSIIMFFLTITYGTIVSFLSIYAHERGIYH